MDMPLSMDFHSRPGFNGAMAVRPWMAATRVASPAGLPCFNGAMAVRPWMVPGAGGRLGAPDGFNGAMAVRPWMGSGAGSPSSILAASMGPWP